MECTNWEEEMELERKRVYPPSHSTLNHKEGTPMRELNFLRDQKLQEAWIGFKWNFIGKSEKAVVEQITRSK